MTLARVALLLPLGGYLLIWGLLTVHRARLGMERLSARGTAVLAFLAFEAVVLAITEVLTVGHHLSVAPLIGAWLLVTGAFAALFHVSGGTSATTTWIRRGGIGRGWRRLATPAAVAVGIVALVVIGLALVATAVLYLPNNADSLVYHLARVASWEQNRSVAHFATHYTAQLELAPLHEFNMLQLHVIADTDQLDGFVQLGSFVACVLGAAEVTRLLGGGREVQVAAALIAAATPSVLLEATSTQNNLFAAGIAVALVVLLLAWLPLGPLLPQTVALGVAAALSILAKGILAPLLAPVVVVLGVRIALDEARRASWAVVLRRAAGAAAVVLVCVLLLAGPFLKRNLDLFGSLTGPVTRTTMNDGRSARASAANVVRSVAVNFRIGDDDGGLDTATSRVALDWLREVHDRTGASEDDPRFMLGLPVDVFEHGDFSQYERTEEYGANAWHVLLMAVAGASLAVHALRGDRRARLPLLFSACLALGFVAFAATTRWSLYVARYELPLLVLWAPLIALALDGVHRVVLRVTVVLLVLAGIPQVVDNAARPLLDRPSFATDIDPYFAPRPDEGLVLVDADDYLALRDALVATGCQQVAIGNWVLLEYPLWVGLESAGWDGELRHVAVRNASGALEVAGFKPCATIRQQPAVGELEPMEGQVDLDFGGLTLSVDSELVDAATGVSPST